MTATLWEDEGSLCFQVEAKGICVARRDGKQDALSHDELSLYLETCIVRAGSLKVHIAD